MSRPASASPGRLLALAALAGTTAVTGGLATALPAAAAPVAIAGHVAEVPVGTPDTGAEHYFNAIRLSNGDTAYGIHEDQPLAPVGEAVLDDEGYAVTEPFDDPESGAQGVVGEKAGEHGVYWTPENAALAGYILSVFGATEDADEALAVHRAVRSLSTAADQPSPELSGLEQSHLDRAAFLVQDARNNVPALVPQDGYRISVSFAPDGRPDALLVQMPEAYYATTVTLSGPVTFADGTTTRTFTGGNRDKYLELAVPAGVTEGELTADVTATMPSTELTVLADDRYRDLFIAGQDRTVDWSASAGFAIEVPAVPDGDAPDEERPVPDNSGTGNPPVDQDQSHQPDTDTDGGTGPGNTDSTAKPIPGGTVRDRDRDGDGGEEGMVVVDMPDTRTTAVVEAFVLFEERTETQTHTVTETTLTTGAAYAAPVTANTGMGPAAATSDRSALVPAVLSTIAVATGLGAWLLHRRRPATPAD